MKPYFRSVVLAAASYCACALVPPPPRSQPARNRPDHLVVVAALRSGLWASWIFADFTTDTGIAIDITYKGSVDIRTPSCVLKQPKNVDIYWPASSLCHLAVLAQNHRSWRPIGLGGKAYQHPRARLGFLWRVPSDVLAAIKSGKLI
jgi:hypothetical protein